MQQTTPITPAIVLGPVESSGPFRSRSSRKYPGYYSRCDTAELLERAKDTLNRWDCILLLHNYDYARLSLGSRKPWHPYQVELLAQIDKYQFRNQGPQTYRDEEEIIKFVSDHQDLWTEDNWIENKYQLPIHHKYQQLINEHHRAS